MNEYLYKEFTKSNITSMEVVTLLRIKLMEINREENYIRKTHQLHELFEVVDFLIKYTYKEDCVVMDGFEKIINNEILCLDFKGGSYVK